MNLTTPAAAFARIPTRIILSPIILCFLAPSSASAAEPIPVQSVLIQLIEEVEVPARVAGALDEVAVREGAIVEKGELLARVDDAETKLQRDRAELDLAIAVKEAQNNVDVRYAKKATEVAQAELKRSLEAVQSVPKAVSETELDHLRLTVERSTLEIEQAEHELELAGLTRRVKENELESAALELSRHHVAAPIDGMVVQVHVRRGEWVEPGEKVLRILRINRLRAEGFIDAGDITRELADQPVKLTVDLPGRPEAEFTGRVVFVSPEIDPVNNQVRVWAEIDNTGLKLRPGMKADMVIE